MNTVLLILTFSHSHHFPTHTVSYSLTQTYYTKLIRITLNIEQLVVQSVLTYIKKSLKLPSKLLFKMGEFRCIACSL